MTPPELIAQAAREIPLPKMPWGVRWAPLLFAAVFMGALIGAYWMPPLSPMLLAWALGIPVMLSIVLKSTYARLNDQKFMREFANAAMHVERARMATHIRVTGDNGAVLVNVPFYLAYTMASARDGRARQTINNIGPVTLDFIVAERVYEGAGDGNPPHVITLAPPADQG